MLLLPLGSLMSHISAIAIERNGEEGKKSNGKGLNNCVGDQV